MRLAIKDKEEKEAIQRFLSGGWIARSMEGNRKRIFVAKTKRFRINSKGELLALEKGEEKKVICEEEHDAILEAIETVHSSAHQGINATWDCLKKQYIGFSRKHVENYIRNCESC
jgi:Integrase zinc binding domain